MKLNFKKFLILLSAAACLCTVFLLNTGASEAPSQTKNTVTYNSIDYEWTYENGALTVEFKTKDYSLKVISALKSDTVFTENQEFFSANVNKLCIKGADGTDGYKLSEKIGSYTASEILLPNLETIIIGGTGYIGDTSGYFFANLKSLKYVEFSTAPDTAAPDCVDLTKMNLQAGSNSSDLVVSGMFLGCSSIKEVILNETEIFNTKFPYIGTAMFADCTSLESINIPSWVTTISDKAFRSCSLTSITLPASVTAIEKDAFLKCTALTSVTLSSSPTVSNKSAFPDSASLTIYCPDQATKDTLTALGYTNTNIVYEDPTLKLLSGSIENCSYVKSVSRKYDTLNWEFDTETGELFIWAENNNAVEFAPSNSGGLIPNATFKEFAAAFGSHVKILNFFNKDKTKIINHISGAWGNTGFGLLSTIGISNIEEIYVDSNVNLYYCGKLFEGLPNITTFGKVGTPIGTVDLSSFTQQGGDAAGTFDGQDGIKVVKLMNATTTQGDASKNGGCFENIPDNYFAGMEGLCEVVLSGKTGSIGANAFDGCTKLTRLSVPVGVPATTSYTNVTLPLFNENALKGSSVKVISMLDPNFADSTDENVKALPDAEGLEIYTTSAALKAGFEGKYTLSELVAIVGTVKSNGFSIRTSESNGLRNLFTFDEALNAELKAFEVELIEYGGILIPANKLEQLGDSFKLNVVRQNNTYFVNTGAATKIPVWSNGVLVGRKLSSSVENVKTDFAVTLVNFTSNFTNDVYACAYSVYMDSYGNEYVEIANYGTENENLKHNSITKIATAMYTNYPATTDAKYEALLKVTVEASPVWNVLYQASTDEGVTDLGEGVYAMTVTNSINGTEYRIVAAAAREAAQAKANEGDICIAVSDIEEKAAALEKKEDSVLTEWNTSMQTKTYNRAEHNAQHPQGMASDGEYVYVSLTGKILKIRISDGEEVGTYTSNIGKGFHMGDMTCHNGYLYGSITGSGTYTSHVFIGVIKCSDIVGDKGDEILNIAHFYEIDSSEANYGFGGIDGIAVGNIPGKGYIDADGTIHKDSGKYLLVAVSGGVRTSDTTLSDTAYDNDNYKICALNLTDVLNNAKPINDDLFCNATGLTSVKPVHEMYTYIGACRYGPQTMEVDKDTGDIILNMYSRPANSVYPEVSGAIVIDGSEMLRLEEIEVGQSVPETSESYAAAKEQAEKYLVDGKYPTGYFATLKCTCGLNGIEKHDCISYGDTGKEFSFCPGSLKVYSNGFVSLGDDFYYILYFLDGSSDADGWTCTIALRKLNHYESAWSYSSYSYN